MQGADARAVAVAALPACTRSNRCGARITIQAGVDLIDRQCTGLGQAHNFDQETLRSG